MIGADGNGDEDPDGEDDADEDEVYRRMGEDRAIPKPRPLPPGWLSPRMVSQSMKSAQVALTQGKSLDDPEVSKHLERLCICLEIDIEDCKVST